MKKISVILLITAIFILSFVLFKNKTISAQDNKVQSSGIEGKLDMVLQNQEKILNKLDEMAKELDVIKVRARR